MSFSTAPIFASFKSPARFLTITFVAFAFMLTWSTASFGDQPVLKPKSYEKWVTSYADAVEKSAATGKPIMLVFSGTDWCSWCTRLSSEVFTTHEFARWSSDNVIKVEVDFPQTYALPPEIAAQNMELKAQFGHHVSSYPTVLFVTADGQFIGKTGYVAGGPEPWIDAALTVIPETPTRPELLANSK